MIGELFGLAALGRMMKTSRLPLRSLEKAIHFPSGEKRG